MSDLVITDSILLSLNLGQEFYWKLNLHLSLPQSVLFGCLRIFTRDPEDNVFISIIRQYNKLQRGREEEFPSKHQCFLCLGRSAYRVALQEEGRKVLLVCFSKMELLSILMVYFVSSLEMEIKPIYSLNNAQHYRLISGF